MYKAGRGLRDDSRLVIIRENRELQRVIGLETGKLPMVDWKLSGLMLMVPI